MKQNVLEMLGAKSPGKTMKPNGEFSGMQTGSHTFVYSTMLFVIQVTVLSIKFL